MATNINMILAIARELRKLEREAARIGCAELALIIGTAGLVASDIVQGQTGRKAS